MSEQHRIDEGLKSATERIAFLSSEFDKAHDAMNEAEERWDEVWDVCAEALKEEMHDAGRTGDPAEHTILSVTRREHRTVYVNWRRAKRAVDKLQRQLKAAESELTGWQSQAKAHAAEVGGQGYVGQRPDPNALRRQMRGVG